MSVTVVLRLQARPGQVGALLAAGKALYGRALHAGTLRAVRALQAQRLGVRQQLGQWYGVSRLQGEQGTRYTLHEHWAALGVVTDPQEARSSSRRQLIRWKLRLADT
jgi:hypothetical protein